MATRRICRAFTDWLEHGADASLCTTLAGCVDRNSFVVSALSSLGADRSMLGWDWDREVYDAPLHSVADCQHEDVFEALVLNPSPNDLDLKDERGSTPLMTLLSETIASKAYLLPRFERLVGRGESCLPFDNGGKRVSQTARGQMQPFQNLIAARVREENWVKRRGFVLWRGRGRAMFGGDDLVMITVGWQRTDCSGVLLSFSDNHKTLCPPFLLAHYGIKPTFLLSRENTHATPDRHRFSLSFSLVVHHEGLVLFGVDVTVTTLSEGVGWSKIVFAVFK